MAQTVVSIILQFRVMFVLQPDQTPSLLVLPPSLLVLPLSLLSRLLVHGQFRMLLRIF